jgi:hypothetical protein
MVTDKSQFSLFLNCVIACTIFFTGCGPQFSSHLVNPSEKVRSMNEDDKFYFKIKCIVSLSIKNSTADISYTKESKIFSFSDLSTSKSQISFDLGPHKLITKFVQFQKNGDFIDPTFCTELTSPLEPETKYCESGTQIGSVIKNRNVYLPFWTSRSYYLNFRFEENDISKISYDCLLLDAKK